MKNITIFQCIPSYKPLPTVRLIKKLLEFKCKILLDIEDSIQDVQHPELTPFLKDNARKDFSEIIQKLPDCKFNIRINSVRSEEFQQDVKLIQKFGDNIESVFIPKVEHSEDLTIFNNEIDSKIKLNLIVETQLGVGNLEEILSSKFNDRIEFVFFGNYDFHLDINLYPITEQNTFNYWKIVKPIISKIENNKINFGNSPYANINDISCLDYQIRQLSKFCRYKFALMSLHKNQTFYYHHLIKNNKMNKYESIYFNQTDFTLDTFTDKKQKGRSFALHNDRIITPQEYLLLFKRNNGKN